MACMYGDDGSLHLLEKSGGHKHTLEGNPSQLGKGNVQAEVCRDSISTAEQNLKQSRG